MRRDEALIASVPGAITSTRCGSFSMPSRSAGRPAQAQRLDDGLGELHRQRGLQHQHRHARGYRGSVRPGHLDAVGGVVSMITPYFLHPADGRQAVGVVARAGHEAERADAGEFVRARQVEGRPASTWPTARPPFSVAANQVEDEAPGSSRP